MNMIRYAMMKKLLGGSGGSGGSGGEEASALDSLIDKSITEITSNATTIGDRVFDGCSKLQKVNLPNTTLISDYAFNNCSMLSEINAPKVTRVGEGTSSYAFSGCSALESAKFPSALRVNGKCFYTCKSLKTLDFYALTYINSYAFENSYIFSRLVLRGETRCTLNMTNAFSNCYHFHGTVNATYNPDGLKDGYIYVPRALVEEYKAATNWSNFAEQIRALEDYTVDGTITGELDESKI